MPKDDISTTANDHDDVESTNKKDADELRKEAIVDDEALESIANNESAVVVAEEEIITGGAKPEPETTAESEPEPKSETKTEAEPTPEPTPEPKADKPEPSPDVEVNEEPVVIAEEDISIASESTESDQAPADTPQPIVAPVSPEPQKSPKPKKSKAPIVILIIVLLAAIGGLATWLIMRSTPEAQVTDAISNLLTAKQVSSTGSINLKFDEAANPAIRSVKLDLGLTSQRIPASTSATLSITTTNNATFKLDLGETIDLDGTLYIKISGLQKAIESAKVPLEIQNFLDYFANVIKKTDNQWWMIAVPDLASQLGETLGQNIDTSYQDAYQCIIDKVAKDDGTELSNLYKKYPFIDVDNYTGTNLQPVDGGSIFSISIDRPQLANFEHELPTTNYQKALQSCIAIVNTDSDTPPNFSEELEKTFDALAELPPAYIEVAGFDHHLARFYYDYDIENFGTLNIDLKFTFPQELSVDIPTSSRNITELINMIVDDTNYMMYDIYGDYYPTDTADNCSPNTNCIKDVNTN